MASTPIMELVKRMARGRSIDPKHVYALPLAWLDVETLLSAVSSALTVAVNMRAPRPVRALSRELALTVATALTMVGLRADVDETSCTTGGTEVPIVFVNLLDCSCGVECGDDGAKVRCDCEGVEVAYRVGLKPPQASQSK